MGAEGGESDDHVQYIQYYTLSVRKEMTTSIYRSNTDTFSLLETYPVNLRTSLAKSVNFSGQF